MKGIVHISELAASGRAWPHPVPSADGQVLGADSLDLPMPEQPHPLLAQMARFVDGPEHALRRAEVLAALPDVAGLEEAAHHYALSAAITGEQLDVVPLARTIPVRVLGEALGVGDLSRQIAALCDSGTVEEGLADIARTSLLFQCRDATAALIVNALSDQVAVERARAVVLTRRAGGVWVLLDQAPFGAGAHECPGREHALALARGVVAAFAQHVIIDRGPNEDRPNLQMPSRLMMIGR